MTRLLEIYLNDHWAGAAAGSSLARRLARHNTGTEWTDRLTLVAEQIDEDDSTLADLRRDFGFSGGRLKRLVGAATERVSRLKPNGRLIGYSPLSRLLEAEMLIAGVTSKRGLWTALGHGIPEAKRPAGYDFGVLERRADDQLEILMGFHREAAQLALAEPKDDPG